MNNPSWRVSVIRYFIESKELNKNGNPKSFPVDVRKLTLNGEFVTTQAYTCTVVKRKGEIRFSVKQFNLPQKSKWHMNELALAPNTDTGTWKREGSYDRDQFTDWLRKRLGVRAPMIVDELLTAPPENLAA